MNPPLCDYLGSNFLSTILRLSNPNIPVHAALRSGTYLHAYFATYVLAYMYILAYIHVHTYIHVCTYMHVCTYIHVRAFSLGHSMRHTELIYPRFGSLTLTCVYGIAVTLNREYRCRLTHNDRRSILMYAGEATP